MTAPGDSALFLIIAGVADEMDHALQLVRFGLEFNAQLLRLCPEIGCLAFQGFGFFVLCRKCPPPRLLVFLALVQLVLVVTFIPFLQFFEFRHFLLLLVATSST